MLRFETVDFSTRPHRTFVCTFGTNILIRSSGRIMNRLSKDMSSIDTEAAESAHIHPHIPYDTDIP